MRFAVPIELSLGDRCSAHGMDPRHILSVRALGFLTLEALQLLLKRGNLLLDLCDSSRSTLRLDGHRRRSLYPVRWSDATPVRQFHPVRCIFAPAQWGNAANECDNLATILSPIRVVRSDGRTRDRETAGGVCSVAQLLRVGLVGLDHWYAGLGAVDDLARSGTARITQIAHRDPQRGRETAEKYGATFTTDYRAVATSPEIDVVLTACYCSENADLSTAAAATGHAIISVKPISMSVAEARRIESAVRAAGVRFISLESGYRVNPTFTTIRGWVDQGRIGRILTAATVLRSSLPTQPWPGERGRTWWLDTAKTPGGGWIDHSIYHIDFLRWILRSEIVSVSGDVGNVIHTDIAPLEDYGIANLVFASGARASVEVTWTGQPGASVHRIELIGTEGTLVWDPSISGRILIGGRNEPAGWLSIPIPQPAGTAAGYVRALQSNALPASIDDAIANLAACEAFYRAARTGSTVRL